MFQVVSLGCFIPVWWNQGVLQMNDGKTFLSSSLILIRFGWMLLPPEDGSFAVVNWTGGLIPVLSGQMFASQKHHYRHLDCSGEADNKELNKHGDRLTVRDDLLLLKGPHICQQQTCAVDTYTVPAVWINALTFLHCHSLAVHKHYMQFNKRETITGLDLQLDSKVLLLSLLLMEKCHLKVRNPIFYLLEMPDVMLQLHGRNLRRSPWLIGATS